MMRPWSKVVEILVRGRVGSVGQGTIRTDQRWQYQWVWKIQWDLSSRRVPGFLPDAPAGWRDHILWRRSTVAAWWTHFTLSACRIPRRWCTQTIKMCIWDPEERPGVGRQIWELFAHVALKLREDGIRREVGQGQISEKLSLILRHKCYLSIH